MSRTLRLLLFPILVFTILAVARPAFAGPPLLCHRFDIGTAKSLAWNGAGAFDSSPSYDSARLVPDTEALLIPATPIVVRMETLRRAAIYASRDVSVAARLLSRLTDRALASESGGRPDALALMDAAYVIEAFRQVGYLTKSPEFADHAAEIAALVKKLDGRALVEKSVLLRPNDAAMEFAAAMINAGTSRDAYAEHARRARAAADKDPLVARNIGLVQ